MMCFFFSSRRRHTRLQGDWSSDVCSSDLAGGRGSQRRGRRSPFRGAWQRRCFCRDRKSTRLNSSHLVISYAVFCLKKKKKDSSKLPPARNYYGRRSLCSSPLLCHRSKCW